MPKSGVISSAIKFLVSTLIKPFVWDIEEIIFPVIAETVLKSKSLIAFSLLEISLTKALSILCKAWFNESVADIFPFSILI